MVRSWYAYLGSGDPKLAGNYLFAVVTPECLNDNNICTIYAPTASIAPTAHFSLLLRRHISNSSIKYLKKTDYYIFNKYIT